jgi:hypothetical protein
MEFYTHTLSQKESAALADRIQKEFAERGADVKQALFSMLAEDAGELHHVISESK